MTAQPQTEREGREAFIEEVARIIAPYEWTAFEMGRLHRSLRKRDLPSWTTAVHVIDHIATAIESGQHISAGE